MLWSLSVWAAPGVLLPHKRNAMRAYATDIIDMGKKYCTVNRLVLENKSLSTWGHHHHSSKRDSRLGIFPYKTQCLKLQEKVSTINLHWKLEAYGKTVLPDKSILIGHKMVENATLDKPKFRYFGWFSNIVQNKENSQKFDLKKRRKRNKLHWWNNWIFWAEKKIYFVKIQDFVFLKVS